MMKIVNIGGCYSYLATWVVNCELRGLVPEIWITSLSAENLLRLT